MASDVKSIAFTAIVDGPAVYNLVDYSMGAGRDFLHSEKFPRKRLNYFYPPQSEAPLSSAGVGRVTKPHRRVCMTLQSNGPKRTFNAGTSFLS